MSVFGVICEYNPFHNGHKYLLEQIKSDNNSVIAVMSGSFTQRGDVAIADKFSRAETAVKYGADLVLELPTVYACAPAETFARGAVQVLRGTGVLDSLCFGSETDDTELLKAAADIFEDERFKTELKANMESGDYYPKAVEKAAETIHSQKLAKLLSTPNNILAVEYLRALRGTDIGFKAVKRVGTNHDSNEVSGEYTSASNIRSIIKQGGSFSSFTPDYEITNPADFKNLERTVLYRTDLRFTRRAA